MSGSPSRSTVPLPSSPFPRPPPETRLPRWRRRPPTSKDAGMHARPQGEDIEALTAAIRGCRVCAPAFAATATGHALRPVPWLSAGAPILLVGQAPGARVHALGRPFDDRSGDRLRDWLGVDRETFYDRRRFAVLPMAFCFPGYD